jgi:twitching motility protein PilT
VILVGEMRDLETISLAITAAETGHLVFATLHTTDAPQTIDRVIDVFPPEQQAQIRMQLSVTLNAVIAQTLLPRADTTGRIAAFEVMVATPAVRALIREGKTHQLYTDIQTGSQYGMQSLDQHLLALLGERKISYEDAVGRRPLLESPRLRSARRPHPRSRPRPGGTPINDGCSGVQVFRCSGRRRELSLSVLNT